MKLLNNLERNTVTSLLEYLPDTGEFFWKVSPKYDIKADTIAGHRAGGYWVIKIKGQQYLAHRLAFLYMEGVWPEEEVDHINRKGLDNRWSNLRKASRIENARNTGLRKDNKSGFRGVHFCKRDRLWKATSSIKGKTINLGGFKDKEMAAKRYQEFTKFLHGDFYFEE